MTESKFSRTRGYPQTRPGTSLRITAVILMTAATPGAATKHRTALFCGEGKLDLSCSSYRKTSGTQAPLVGFAPLDERYANQAYVVRWGEGNKNDAQPRWIVSVGNFCRQALFWAAVASVLL